jgi:hypothetical protein
MAEAILFLSTDEVQAIHGATLLLDEGISAGAFWAEHTRAEGVGMSADE